MSASDIDINKQHTRKRFDFFYKWSKEALDKEFDTAVWQHINVSEITALSRLLDKLNNRDLVTLDAGCGSGRLLFDLKKRYAKTIGSDFSLGLLKKAKDEGGHDTYLIQSEAENLPFKNESFDIILSVRVIQHLRPAEQQRAIDEMSRLLKKGGRLILMTYNALSLLCLYKNINMSRLYNIWPRWPLKHWNWVVDNYSLPWELKRMFKNAGLKTRSISGCVLGDPEILKSIKISNVLEKCAGTVFKSSLQLCRVIDAGINRIWPFKYLLGRILIEGEK